MSQPTELELDAACDVLTRGGVVAAATESSFGLLVDARNSEAIDALLELKPRDPNRGVGLMAPNSEVWLQLVQPPALELRRLAQAFWPGPLTLVAPAHAGLDARLVVTEQVAVRVPGPSPAAALVQRFGRAVTATSANLTGEPPCEKAEQLRGFGAAWQRLHLLPGDAPGGPPSTFVAWRGQRLEILRPGALSLLQLEQAISAAQPG